MHRHDGRVAQQTAKLYAVAHLSARYGDDAHGHGFVVDHADGRFIRDDGRDGFGRGIAGDGDHIQADGAHAGHGFLPCGRAVWRVHSGQRGYWHDRRS